MKHIRSNTHYQASSLLYVLVVVVVLAAMSSALISLSSYQRLLFDRDALQERLAEQATAGMNMLVQGELTGSEPVIIAMGPNEEDTLRLLEESWGVFDLATVKYWHHTAIRKEEVVFTGLIGLMPDTFASAALYLADHAQPLVLAGSCRIAGTVYLPEAGVRTGYIEDVGFSGINLIDGIRKRSKTTLPPIQALKLTRLIHQLSAKGKTENLTALADSIDQSFAGEAIWITGKSIRITNQILTGRILVKADSLIHISRTARLEDILLIAPKIEVEQGFSGNLQAFAGQSITIGDGVALAYPSVLGIFAPETTQSAPFITIGEQCTIEGFLFGLNPSGQDDLFSKITIGKESVLQGQLYSDGSVDLQGAVWGNITCRGFTIKRPVSSYFNYLLNAEIESGRRPLYLTGSALRGDVRKNKLVKRLQ